ncbi:MAG: transporter substrate-binding domain-containing protein [Verrucomicrobia bacterium]|nr:transporter substrate-binding domain-containing protein [Verrucomicrobiota bacterium]
MLSSLLVGLSDGLLGTDLEATKILRVGMSGDYAPFSSTKENDKLEGFEIELAKAFAADRRMDVEFVIFQWVDLLKDLETGKFDVAMSGVTVREDRSMVGRFTVPIARSGAVVIVGERGKNPPLESFNHPGIRIGVNHGGHLERVTRKTFPNAFIVTSNDNQRVPVLLTENKVDAIVTDTMEAPHWLRRLPDATALAPFSRDNKAWLVHPEKVELADQLDAWLLAKEADGTLGNLRQAYLPPGNEFKTATPLPALLAAMDERLSLMVAVAESKRVLGKPVEDLAQEARVIEAAVKGVIEESQRQSVGPPDTSAVEAFFKAQIEAAKAIQFKTLEGPATMTDPPDLVEELRPALGRISGRINRLVFELRRGEALKDLSALQSEVSSALENHALTQEQLSAIGSAIFELGKNSH